MKINTSLSSTIWELNLHNIFDEIKQNHFLYAAKLKRNRTNYLNDNTN